MRVCGLPVLSAASLSETARGAGGADTADPSSTATAAEPMRVGSAASAAGAPAQTTPSDCKLGANLSGNALGEDVNEETTRGLQLDPATTARTANVGPAPPRGADISVLRHIDANNFHFNMLNEAGAAAAQTPNEVVPTSSSPTSPSPTPPEASTARSADHRAAWEGEASATELDASEEEEEVHPSRREKPVRSEAAKQRRHRLQAVRRRLRVEGLSIGASGGGGDEEGSGGGGAASSSDGASANLNSEVLALRRALADREAVLKLTRKQLRRQTKTSKARHAQLARKDSKAAKKAVKQQKAKVARDIAGAARRERRRKWKGAVAPEGESVHSSDAKRRRLLEKGVEIASGGSSSSQPTMRMAAAGREAAEALAAPTRGSGRSRGSEGGGGGRNAGQCWLFASTGQCRYGGHCKFAHGTGDGGGGGSGGGGGGGGGSGGGGGGGGGGGRGVCRYFAMNGRCQYGGGCRFSHVTGGGSGSGDGDGGDGGGVAAAAFAAAWLRNELG